MRVATWNVNSIRSRVDRVTDWLAMIAYVFAGPDGTKAGPPRTAPAPA